jgi:hypothetical protein
MSGADPAGFGPPPDLPGGGYPGGGSPGGGYPGGLTPEQLAYRQGQQDMLRQVRQPRMTPFRVLCGILWAAIAIGFAIGGIDNAAAGNWGELAGGLIIAGLAGWYDYRIWTLKARRLWFII